jgi:hypothetical protein
MSAAELSIIPGEFMACLGFSPLGGKPSFPDIAEGPARAPEPRHRRQRATAVSALCAPYYGIARWFFVRDISRKLRHMNGQLAIAEGLHEDQPRPSPRFCGDLMLDLPRPRSFTPERQVPATAWTPSSVRATL